VKSRLFVLVLTATLLGTGCMGKKVNRLSNTEFDHYYALKPFMDDAEEKTFLKKKTEEERNAYLQEIKLWDRFYSLSPSQREEVLTGKVVVGWSKNMVLMAWGPPWDQAKLIGSNTYNAWRWIYRFEKQADGSALVYVPGSKTAYKSVGYFSIELILKDDKVVELNRYKGWKD
jgi:hypothetical protein